MNELIEIKTNENLEPIISGRELHEKLGVESKYQDWIKRMLDYGFIENIDFSIINELSQKKEGSRFVERNLQNHLLKLDTAKEICMLQRNEKGKQFRKYFIAVEKDFNSPEKVMARALLFANKKVNLLDVKVQELENKIEQDRPRVAFAETIEKASDCILVREFAKLLANEDIHIGEKKIYKQLREWGYILLYSTEPTQRAVQQGLFKIKESVISTIKGDMIGKTTLITGKGQLFLLDKFKKKLTEN